MSDSSLFATYLIGLREGLEATLVVSILVAYLLKTGRRGLLPHVAAGAIVAIALSVSFGAILTYTKATLLADERDQELFAGVTSVAAVVFVTWMIFWMRRAAQSIASELRGRLGAALAIGPFAVAAVAFLAVVREGLETALIFFGAVQGADSDTGPLLALLAGIVTAAAIGVGLAAGGVRINLTRFFTWTGALLVLVAAGILKYGVHEFQETGVLPENGAAFDVTSVLDRESWYGALLNGMFNITGDPTWLELLVWAAYAIPVLVIFLSANPRKPRAGCSAGGTAETPGKTTPAPAAHQA